MVHEIPSYPAAPKSEQVDVYHGVSISDPYRDLEFDTTVRRNWIDAQVALTENFLESQPQRTVLEQIAKRVWNYPVMSVPVFSGGRWFAYHSDGVRNQRTIITSRHLKSSRKWRTLVDPNLWSDDGSVAINNFIPSPDGKLLMFCVTFGGSREETWRIVDTATGIMRPDVISTGFQPRWSADSKAVYTSESLPVTEISNGEGKTCYRAYLRYHRLGTNDNRDYWAAIGKPSWLDPMQAVGQYLIAGDCDARDKNAARALFVFSTEQPDARSEPLFGGQKAKFVFVASRGETAFFLTDLDAPRGRLISVDLTRGPAAEAVTVIQEQTMVLNACVATRSKFVVEYLDGPMSRLYVHGRGGLQEREIALPTVGTVQELSARSEGSDTAVYSFDSVAKPGIIWQLNASSGNQVEVFRKQPPGLDGDSYETLLRFAVSEDGTKIPFMITQKKGTVCNGKNFACLYVYGGFGISLRPQLDKFNMPWLEAGGIIVTACVRGGGEYGRLWYQTAVKTQKHKTLDDVYAIAEWLAAEGVTQPKRLALRGGSNGGFIVAACAIKRPELFGAVITQSGVHDQLRYDAMSGTTGWSCDYGSSSIEEEFKAQLKISPLQNVRPDVDYPAFYVFTGMNDGTVSPGHSFKLLAALQEVRAGKGLVLGGIMTNSGHSISTDSSMNQLRQTVDAWTFAAAALGMELTVDPLARVAA